MKSLNKLGRRIGQLAIKDLKRDWNFKEKVKVKLTKLGAKGKESPLFCKHEHCVWWQLKHYLIKESAKEKAKEKLKQ